MGRQLREKKRKWFRAGADELAALWPQLDLPKGIQPGELYACPLCAELDGHGLRINLFQEAHLQTGLLTAEHVPPRHCGGSALVLICKACNDRAGHTVDAASSAVERGLRFHAGLSPGKVEIRVGEYTLPAILEPSPSGRGGKFRVLPHAPGRIAAFRDSLSGMPDDERTIRLSYTMRDVNDPIARTSWLKAAYLVMFALYGYRYVFHEALERVRRQVQEPAAEHLTTFAVRLPGLVPFSERRAFRISDPALPPCWGVQMGPHVVFMPREPSDRLYACLAELKTRSESLQLHISESFWPVQRL